MKKVIIMNDLQKCQLNILIEFIRLCEKHHLTYYLVGGSCLGAVRHKGFIPWDDDIDVGMPRKDYDRFIQLQSEVNKPYFIQTYKTDKNYIYNYAKLRDSSTTYIENYFVCHQFNHGVWIDIFPLDGMSKEIKPAYKFEKKVKWTWRQVYLMYLPSLKRKLRFKTLFKDISLNIVALLFIFFNVGHYRNKLVDKKVTKINYDDAVLVGNFFGTNPKKEAMPKEIFENGVDAAFEGVKVKIPKDYNRYLTLLYGNYMQLPPIEKQIGHHYDKGISLTEDYLTYRKKHNL